MQSSSDERTLAALAHASIVTNGLSLIGLIGAAMIWATQREHSAYVRGHAIQALVFQGMVIVITLILALSWGMCVALSLLPIALRPELYPAGSFPAPFWLALSGMILPVLFGLAASVYGLFGALQAYRGKPFFYPLVGRLAAADLNPPLAPVAPTESPAPVIAIPAAEPPPLPTPIVPAATEPSATESKDEAGL
jgi:uncharacterized Tic20 family protein